MKNKKLVSVSILILILLIATSRSIEARSSKSIIPTIPSGILIEPQDKNISIKAGTSTPLPQDTMEFTNTPWLGTSNCLLTGECPPTAPTPNSCYTRCNERYSDTAFRRFCYARFDTRHSAYPGEGFCGAIHHSERNGEDFIRLNDNFKSQITSRLRDLCVRGWRNESGDLIDNGNIIPELQTIDEIGNCEDRPNEIPSLASQHQVAFEHRRTPGPSEGSYDFTTTLRNLAPRSQEFVVAILGNIGLQYGGHDINHATINGTDGRVTSSAFQTGAYYGCMNARTFMVHLEPGETFQYGNSVRYGFNRDSRSLITPNDTVFVFKNNTSGASLGDSESVIRGMLRGRNDSCTPLNPIYNSSDPSIELIIADTKEGHGDEAVILNQFLSR